jgi:hypothetical protein
MSTTWSSLISDGENLYQDVDNTVDPAQTPAAAAAATTTPTWVWYLLAAVGIIFVLIIARD